MTRFAGVKNGKICIISDKNFSSDAYQSLNVPEALEEIASTELIDNYKIRNNRFVLKQEKIPLSELKIAFVSNYKMRCGIASYLENLAPEIISRIGDYKFFIEENQFPTGPLTQLGNQTIPENKIETCWKRGESLQKLATAIKEYNPDIVLINHEWGIFPNARYWLSFMNQISDFRIITILHSVFHHKDKVICEAACPEIIVHLDGAKQVLQEEKQISAKVTVIPHGCKPFETKEKLWNFYKTEQTFIQAGFGFSYKNWGHSIKATAILKQKYPEIFFTGLFSESPFCKMEHEIYYNELMEEVAKLDLLDNVSLIRGFQSDEVLDCFLRLNKVAVFPYASTKQHEVFGVSGAARTAMSKGIPVITSTVNHFSDLDTIKADSPEEIADALDKLFSDWKLRRQQIDKQNKYLSENTWEQSALKYIKVFENK